MIPYIEVSANSESKRKKKAAVAKCKGRPKQVTVVYLNSIPKVIPKGTSREKLKKEGRIKDIPFHRFISKDEVQEIITASFPEFSKKFKFLQGRKSNTLSLSSNQDLDGNGVIELAKHGSLYLLESDVPNKAASESGNAVSSESLLEPQLSQTTSPKVQVTSSAHEETPADDLMQRADAIVAKLKVSQQA